ncbi:MAG: phenylalanine--tRNA ligase subunit beta [Salinibacterium sp.]|nr:phenylalanine--tRNA ligase subunit beta [Salinibacterium sp.]
MRVPISWLREFVAIPEDVTFEQVHAALVKVGFEEEDVHSFDVTGPVVVGKVLEFTPEPQSNGKTINWVQVDVGEDAPRGIVCGAHNFAVGDKVVVSLPGAVLPGPFPIAARKTYGHVSDGMMASARELGLGDEHDGILLLKNLGLDPEVGADAIPLLGIDDFAVEINVTPDRGYAFSIRGVAREYAHSTGAAFRDPADAVTPSDAHGFSVTVADEAPIRGNIGVSVFMARAVRGIDPTRPTPAWMVSRLTLAGIRSISLVVDISNYVMLELGQPNHTYDLDKLRGGFTIRRAKAGEKFETLDGQVRTLSPEDLLIDDESGPVGLAGVMGGASTEISDSTTNVLVEAANWDPVTIARTARRHKLWSEAARRYERGVDPKVPAVGVARVVQLLEELGGGTGDDLGIVLDNSVPPSAIELPDGYVTSLIGAEFSADEVTDSLQEIGTTVVASDSGWTVTPPTWRPDLTDRATLAEEVARIVGYDRIPSVLPVAPPGRGLTREQRLRRLASSSLAAGGLTEVLAYPFLAQASNDQFGSPETGGVAAMKIANPLDPDAAWLRTSLLPGLIAIARRNLSRGLTDLSLYEVGTVFRPVAGHTYGSGPLPAGDQRPSAEVLEGLRASIPPQPWHVGALFLGDAVTKQPGQPSVSHGLSDALGAAQHLATVLASPITITTGSHQAMHPGRTAELRSGDRVIGYAGELLPSLAADLDLPRVVAVLELDLDALIALSITEVTPSPILGLPAATQDLSLVVSSTVSAGDVLALLVEGAGELLEKVTLVDDYRGAGVPDGSKSLTFALRFRAADRTLTQAEATEAKNAAVAVAAARVGAILRE